MTSPGKPSDHDVVPLADALDWQIEVGRRRNAPIATEMLVTIRDAAAGPLAGVLPDQVRFGDLIGLRLLGFLHRIALERKAPALALWFPTLGGLSPFDAPDPHRAVAYLRAATVDAVLEHPDELAYALRRVPQTNETGRSVMLRCVLSRIDGPVRLVELACSAGLNLRADHLPGDPELEAGPMPVITERIGCDLDPIDPTSTEGRLLLSSYIWVDSVDRFERLRRALVIAEQVPAMVVQADAAEFLAGIEPTDGVTTLIWHSAMWMYLEPTVQDGIIRELARLGAQATPDRPVVSAGFEWDGQGDGSEFDLTVCAWGLADVLAADGEPRVLARGSSHGLPVPLT